jgi:molybdenum cofactor cytidylyltransferase
MEDAEISTRVGCVVMAAGNARRFGENKLTAALDGRTLIRRALEAVPPESFARVAVVTQYEEILRLAESFGFAAVYNDRPQDGASRSLRLGLVRMEDCAGVLFQAADQPLLRRETVEALVRFWRERPACIAALGHGGVRGNPCLFPRRFFPELAALTGDVGGSAVIRAHPEALALLEVNPEELRDVDTPEALEALRRS